MPRQRLSRQGIPDAKYREARRLRREMTVAEQVLWSRLRGNRLENYHFRRQHVLCGFIVDFYCRRAGLAVEVDGGIHTQQKCSDEIRDAILLSRGVLVIRFPNASIENEPDGVTGTILAICMKRDSNF
jgi:very-short-patch-repair endonuclease